MSGRKITPVVIDCDPGVDDAWAIISLLRGEEKFGIKLKAVTVVIGNTTVDNSSRNALLILETFNRLDVPVFVGSESALIRKPPRLSIHGKDGFSDVYDKKPDKSLVQEKSAVEALKDIIEEEPGEVVVFAVGPLTNIALLYKLYPGISSKIKALWIMGGNHLGRGNVTKCGEFNFWYDPEAAHIVLEETTCPMFIFPWEACLDASKETPLHDWRLKVLPSVENPVTKLMDPVDEKYSYHQAFIPADAYLTCCFLVPRMIKTISNYHVTVELNGQHSRGQMIIDYKGIEKPNAQVIQSIDTEIFKRLLMWFCDHDISDFD